MCANGPDPVDLPFLAGFCFGLDLFGGGGGVWLVVCGRRFHFVFFFLVFFVGGGVWLEFGGGGDF